MHRACYSLSRLPLLVTGGEEINEMLSSCVNHFYECAERVAEQTIQLQNMMESNKVQASQQIEDLIKLHRLYKALVEFPQDGATADFEQLKKDIMTCEGLLSLGQDNAQANFKGINTDGE